MSNTRISVLNIGCHSLILILNSLGINWTYNPSLVSADNQSLESFIYISNNNNSENNEGSSSNSKNNSENSEDSDYDDVEDCDAMEVDNHNGPEQVVEDLNNVDKARNNDQEALDELKREYPAFFEDNSVPEALNQIEHYLESEFPGELERSEKEADELDGRGGRSNNNNNNDDDGNNSSGGSGPSAPSGPSGSGSGPSGSDSGPSSGGSLSKVLIILGAILETISKVLEDVGNYM